MRQADYEQRGHEEDGKEEIINLRSGGFEQACEQHTHPHFHPLPRASRVTKEAVNKAEEKEGGDECRGGALHGLRGAGPLAHACERAAEGVSNRYQE